MSIERCLAELRAGRPVIVLDDASREDEADLVLAAEHADVDAVAFFLEHTSGFLCVALPADRTAELDLPQMVDDPTDPLGTAFTVSVDATSGITTGISAAERARTIALLGSRQAGPGDFTRPGHVMPLRARAGGVLERRGHTEAAVDLCAAAGLTPAGLICEMVTPDRRGMLARHDVNAFARRQDLTVVTIEELVEYRRRRPGVTRGTSCRMPTAHGDFTATVFTSPSGAEHLALVHGDPTTSTPLVRVHSECLTGDTLASRRCDCGDQLHAAMAQISEADSGVLVYLGGHEGRGIGLTAKIAAYALQDGDGLDTVDANLRLGRPVDARDYADAATILADLGVGAITLMSNNPAKADGLSTAGVVIESIVGLEAIPNVENADYLATKRDRMGHRLLGSTGGGGMMPETFEDLFESAAMMYAAPDWRAAARDVTAVLGAPSFTDGAGWAAWPELKLSDETTGPAWSLLAKTRDLDAVIARASELEWAVGEQSVGGHETRVRLTAPSGLAVIAYSPLS